jgi:hypothetical protein
MKPISLTSLFFALLFFSCDIRQTEIEKTQSATQKKQPTYTTSAQIIDTTYHFGKVKEGDVVEFSYRFKNTGTKPLVIEQAAASCGCTVPEKPEHPIAPGEMGYIKVKFNSQGRPGEAQKTISVTSNARPDFPILYLKGTVIGKEKE